MDLKFIAKQISDDLRRRLTRDRLKNAEAKVLEKMDDIKNRESRSGNSPARGGRWNNVYNKQYAKREKNGRRSPVTLTNGRAHLRETTIIGGNKRSKLAFRDGKFGQIFNYHQKGIAKGGKFRQIYPENDKQVPKALDITARREVLRILNG